MMTIAKSVVSQKIMLDSLQSFPINYYIIHTPASAVTLSKHRHYYIAVVYLLLLYMLSFIMHRVQ